MKTSYIVIGLIIIAAIGYFVFMQPAAAPTIETQSGDQAPSMNSGQEKIDINAVCEGALAYTTFENGAAAEAWVQECKDGEHPEAIEQWKVQMGITDDRAI